jgi:hypothetical protein
MVALLSEGSTLTGILAVVQERFETMLCPHLVVANEEPFVRGRLGEYGPIYRLSPTC